MRNQAVLMMMADLLLINGKIWTLNPAQPIAEAVACVGSRIVAVGSTAEVRKWADAGTRVVDLGGKLVVPGFNDAHVHFYAGGSHLEMDMGIVESGDHQLAAKV